MLATKHQTFRTVTNGGDPAKTYARVLKSETDKDWSLYLQRYVLTEKHLIFEATGHRLVKKYKDKYLYYTEFGLQIKSLAIILEWLEQLKK